MEPSNEEEKQLVGNEGEINEEISNDSSNKFDFSRAKTYVLDAAKAIEDFGSSLYENTKSEGVTQTTKKLYGDVSSKISELSTNIKSQLDQTMTREKINSIANDFKEKFNETTSTLPTKLSDASMKAKEFATTKINDSIEFIQNSPVLNEYGFPIVTALRDGISDQAYQVDQKYHVVGNIGNVVKGIDDALGLKEKTQQIDNYFGISGIINSVVEKTKEIDQYLTGGIGTNIANKGYEVTQKFVEYAVDETHKVCETKNTQSEGTESHPSEEKKEGGESHD